MQVILSGLIMVLVVSDMYHLAPGLSVKNALLYMIASGLLVRFIVKGGFSLKLPRIHLAFAALFTYAILSLVAITVVTHYPPRYDVVEAVYRLKGDMLDPALYFFLFFYAIRTRQEAQTVLMVLLITIGVANSIAVADAVGVLHIGELRYGAEGDTEGGR